MREKREIAKPQENGGKATICGNPNQIQGVMKIVRNELKILVSVVRFRDPELLKSRD
jgi:hypothetical protein